MTPLALLAVLALGQPDDTAHAVEAPPIGDIEPAPEPPPIVPRPYVRTAASETITLPRSVVVRADPLAKEIVLVDPNPAQLAESLRVRPSEICPTNRIEPGQLVLECRSRKLEATSKRRVLEIRETLGPPESIDETRWVERSYAPVEVDLGACPGTNDAAVGECALAAGKLEAAVAAWERALQTEHRAFAAMRLGDLARARGGFADASGLYEGAGRRGPWGRMAMLRVCELKGTCHAIGRLANGYNPLDDAALPDPLALEMRLRGARILAFNGELENAIAHLVPYGSPEEEEHICRDDIELCQRITLQTLREAKVDDKRESIAFYLTLPKRYETTVSVALAHEVAKAATELNAPGFGAAILAGATRVVPDAERVDHLLATAELYVAAFDRTRGNMVLDYATSLATNEAQKERARELAETLKRGPVSHVPPVDAAAEMERARSLLSRVNEREAAPSK